MSSFKNTAKSIFNKLFVLLLLNFAYFSVFFIVIAGPITQKEQVKSWLDKSGVYENIVDATIDLSRQGQETARAQNPEEVQAVLEEGDINYDELIAIIERVYPPTFFETSTETIIDSVYAWLDGKTPQPEFSISLAAGKDQLAVELTNFFTTQIAALPPCTDASQIGPDFNPVTATCLPPGVDVTAQVSAFVDEIIAGPLFSETLDTADLQIQPDALTKAPEGFTNIRTMLWLLPVITLVFLLAVIVTGKTFISGVRAVGAAIFIAGILLLVSFWLVDRSGDVLISLTKQGGPETPKALLDLVIHPLIRVVTNDMANAGYLWAAGVTGIGGVTWGIARWIDHKKADKEIDRKMDEAAAGNGPRPDKTMELPKSEPKDEDKIQG